MFFCLTSFLGAEKTKKRQKASVDSSASEIIDTNEDVVSDDRFLDIHCALVLAKPMVKIWFSIGNFHSEYFLDPS